MKTRVREIEPRNSSAIFPSSLPLFHPRTNKIKRESEHPLGTRLRAGRDAMNIFLPSWDPHFRVEVRHQTICSSNEGFKKEVEEAMWAWRWGERGQAKLLLGEDDTQKSERWCLQHDVKDNLLGAGTLENEGTWVWNLIIGIVLTGEEGPQMKMRRQAEGPGPFTAL